MDSNSLLGFADGPITAGAAVDALTSKVGGQPIVYGGVPIGLRCKSCDQEAYQLVCQIYCPVDHLYNRTLYLFCCPATDCHRTSNGWVVLRMQDVVKKSKQPVKPSEPAAQDMVWSADGDDDWGDAADDWGDAADDWGDAADGWGTTNEESLPQSTETAVETETAAEESSDLSNKRERERERLLIKEYDLEEGKIEKSKGGAGRLSSTAEHYEKTYIAHGDKLFYKFTKTLSLNPSQIIRYEYGGTPLPMTPLDHQAIPSCESCGAARTFEMQVMPALAQMLTIGGVDATLDIGTVIVFSCSSNCWSGKTLREHVVVQHDPDEQLVHKTWTSR